MVRRAQWDGALCGTARASGLPGPASESRVEGRSDAPLTPPSRLPLLRVLPGRPWQFSAERFPNISAMGQLGQAVMSMRVSLPEMTGTFRRMTFTPAAPHTLVQVNHIM